MATTINQTGINQTGIDQSTTPAADPADQQTAPGTDGADGTVKPRREHNTYAAFWPFYLREHAQPGTRLVHFAGTYIALGLAIAALVTLTWWLVPAAIVAGYLFAWISHAFIERNRPATFTYPLWSFISDWRMAFLWTTGGLGKELDRAGV